MTRRLYIFDLDGTLVDSAADICAACTRAVAELAPSAAAASALPYIGRPLGEIFAAMAPGEPPEPLIARYREIYAEICTETTLAFPGVETTLEKLAGAHRAIATTKKSWLARLLVERLGLARHFDLVQGTDDFPYKPDPAILYRVLNHFGVKPQEALMVGDTRADILSAQAAGVPCAAAMWGFGAAELRDLRPDYLLDRFEDLLGIPGGGLSRTGSGGQ